MGDLFLLSVLQMARLSPFFPLPHGVPQVVDWRYGMPDDAARLAVPAHGLCRLAKAAPPATAA